MSISEALEPDNNKEDDSPKAETVATVSPTSSNVESAPAEPVTSPSPSVDPVLDAIMGRIVPVSDIPHRRKVLIYSDPGAGKTIFAATAPNPLIHDTENGTASINNHPELVNKVKVLPFVSLYQFEQLIIRMIEGNNPLDEYDTYVIDTLSNLHKTGLADTTVTNAQAKAGKNEFVAETEDHTENNERIRRMVSKLNELSATKNIIILCHCKKIERRDKSLVFSPDFSDKLTNAINALVDVVGYMHLKEENGTINRYLRLRGDQNYTAKTRFASHPVEIVNPTWDTLFPPETAKVE